MANNTSYEILRYPYEIIGDKTDYLQIAVTDYSNANGLVSDSASARQATLTASSVGPLITKKAVTVPQYIVLPMP